MVRIEKLDMYGFKSFAKKTLITFPSNFSVVTGPNGSGKSSKYDTQVQLTTGEMKPIGKIVEDSIKISKSKGKLDDGILTFENPYRFKVCGIEPKTMKIVEKDIRAFIKRRGEPHLYKTITRTGLEVVTTACHPLMVFNGKKIISKRIEELSEGDLIAIPNKLELDGTAIKLEIKNIRKNGKKVNLPGTMNENLARFLGYFIGNGYWNKYYCSLSNSDESVISDFISLGDRLFNIKHKISKTKSNKTKNYILYSSKLSSLIYELLEGNVRAGNKIIPESIFRSSNKIIANLLASLFDCDGTVDKNKTSIEYSSKSKMLIEQIRSLLLRFGINCKMKKKIKYISKRKNKIKRKYYYAYIDGIKNLKRFYKNMPIRHNKKLKRLEYHLKRKFIPQRTYENILPKQVNKLVRECKEILGIKYKPLRKKYPTFAAYIENRCYPTKEGVQETEKIFKDKIREIEKIKLKMDKDSLVKVLDTLNIKRRHAAKIIGLGRDTINNSWIHNNWKGKKENRKKLYDYIKNEIKTKLKRAKDIIRILNNLSNSNILWDKIVKIKKVKGEKWVYDLEIPDCHNFIGNGIFIHNSNILDAVCFVLGRTSAKSLRADKMLEVIFLGTKTKPPAEFAKVALYFDNSDRKFTLEEDQIIISRKVNRKGISIYKLNGKTVNRETILEILRPAHILPDGHNIILQGDVTDVIEMSPLERREIIDEISGIREYDEKREKAQRELMTVEERIKEASIILGERSVSLERLEFERKLALEYKKFSEELDKLRASLARKKLDEADSSMKKLDQKIEEKEKDDTKYEKELEKIDKELDDLEKKRDKIGERLIDRSADIKIIKNVESLRAEIIRKKDKIETNKIQIQRLDDLITRLQYLHQKELESSTSRAVQEIVKLGRTGIYGTIASLSKVPSEYQTAIEVAAGHHLHDIVVATEDIAIECVNHLKKNKIGRATFLPLDKIKPRESKSVERFLKKNGIINLAINLIEFDKKYFDAFSFIFGDTLVIDKIETAKKLGIGEARFVTLDGDLIEKSGAIIGGFYRIEKRVFADTTNINKYVNQKNQLENEIQVLDKEIIELNKKLEGLTTEEQLGSKQLVKMQQERQDIEKKLESLRSKRKDFYENKIIAQQEVEKWKINKARLEASLENLKVEYENYKDIKETYDLAVGTLENKVRDCLSSINALGLINMKALEEYKIQKKEYDELKSKVDKLTEERDRVLTMMAEIEGKRKETFTKTLNAISEQFKIVFRDLAGGEADVHLETDDLESGLIIEASPGGKKLLNIDAMSGGEKTLTALAFLFAIQRYKPAPFYVLDEIDAALDRPNTKKAVELIKKYSDNSQFIIISHNDTTVQAADCVYGVSMEEGESKLVGIRMPS